MGVRIRGTLGDIDPLNKVPFKRAIRRVKKGSPLRRPPNTTWDVGTRQADRGLRFWLSGLGFRV